MLHRWLTLLLGLLCSPPLLAEPAPLTMAFNHRPPYHYLVDQQPIPQGLTADILVRVLYDANVRVNFVEMPGHRIMAETKKDWPFCSFTWFKNRERSQFAKFSLPLWQDAPFTLVTHRRNMKKFQQHERLEGVLLNTRGTLGSKSPISYGRYVDLLLNKKRNEMQIERIPTSQIKIIQMLDQKRFDAVLLTPEEAPGLFKSAKVDFSEYVSLDFQDIPEGDTRRIMCSKAVSDELIEQLNRSIRKLAPVSIPAH